MGGKILYSRKYNLEYYNITKCGMTSICNSLKITGEELSTVPEDRRIFTVIRNPLDRFLSSFLHCRKNQLGDNKGIYHKDIVKSFELFLKEIEDNGFFDSHNNTQMWFLDKLVTKTITTPRDFNKITDFILFEEMDEKLKILVGEDIKIKWLNSGVNQDKQLLKPKIVEFEDRIIKLYKEDWDLYQSLVNK